MQNNTRFSQERVDALLAKGVQASALAADGSYTKPRSWGVYEIAPPKRTATRLYRLGNHPVRQRELEQEFGKAKVVSLFTSRTLAEELAKLLNLGTSSSK
ncbi:MAG: hypothetical protein KF892_24060 [Rhizobacter sp.]|nr:hypothetical protein [Rhizobacter sp.]